MKVPTIRQKPWYIGLISSLVVDRSLRNVGLSPEFPRNEASIPGLSWFELLTPRHGVLAFRTIGRAEAGSRSEGSPIFVHLLRLPAPIIFGLQAVTISAQLNVSQK